MARPRFGGELRCIPAGAPRDGAAVWTRLADGRSIGWWPPPGMRRCAVDAEIRTATAPQALRRARALVAGAGDDLEAWTRLEVEAKITNIPVVMLLRDGTLRPRAGAIAFETIRTETLVVTVGCGDPSSAAATLHQPEPNARE